MERERLMESERLQIERIRELEMEELQVEEVDDDDDVSDPSSDVDFSDLRDHSGFIYDACLTSLDTDIGEVERTHWRIAFKNCGGAILNLPMFYLEGTVLFPQATLPLRVIQARFKASVERAMSRADAPSIIGVVCVCRCPNDAKLTFATIGTTAEIQQYRQLDDGSLDIVAHGRQRFHLQRRWVDMEGAPWAEVKLVQEDLPLRTPKDAFGQLASVTDFQNRSNSNTVASAVSCIRWNNYEDEENDWECLSNASTESDSLVARKGLHRFSISSCNEYGSSDESTSSDGALMCGLRCMLRSGDLCQPCFHEKMSESDDGVGLDTVKEPVQEAESVKMWKKYWAAKGSKSLRGAPRAFWPCWVYRMYDSYCLAQRVASMWKQIIGTPNMDGLVNKPDILSFYIAGKIPVSESTRQELLEIDGVSYRLRREIELLDHLDLIRCKACLNVVAKRSDMLVDGPLSAFANLRGYMHEVMTLYNSNGLALIGSPVKEHNWFPGYAWTTATCLACESNMGWLFTATNKKLQPRSFWGIRIAQVVDGTC